MNAFASICFGGALVLAIVAIKHQRANFVPRHGASTGGDIVNQLLWVLVSLLVAAGSFGCISAYVAAFVSVTCFMLSFLIRYFVESWERSMDQLASPQSVAKKRKKNRYLGAFCAFLCPYFSLPL